MDRLEIPLPVISAISEVVSEMYSHSELVNLAESVGIPGDAGLANKLQKVRIYLKYANSHLPHPLSTLGKFLQKPFESMRTDNVYDEKREAQLNKALADNGLAYYSGGYIRPVGVSPINRTFEEHLQRREFASVSMEFERIARNLDSDPDAAVTASCALLESLFRTLLSDNPAQLPSDLSIKPLWKAVQKRLNLETQAGLDQDVQRINSGLSSIIEGIGSLRTHRGSAHGHGGQTLEITRTEARLAAHACFTLASFVIELWTNLPLAPTSL